MSRDLIIVDIETTGLDPETCMVLEIAAVNGTTGETLHLIPPMPPIESDYAPALQINRYFERGIWKIAASETEYLGGLFNLRRWIDGNTFGGSNPRFDLAVLQAECIRKNKAPLKPHHRLADLAAYAAGAFGDDPENLQGLADICKRLNVTNAYPHSAMGDAQATLACFRELQEKVANR